MDGAHAVHVAEQILGVCEHLLANLCAFALSDVDMI